MWCSWRPWRHTCRSSPATCPGYSNVARSGIDAVLVPPGDPDALAGALRSVLADSRLAETLAVAGDARAAEFAMDRLAERYLELYAQVVDRVPGP